MVEALLPWKPGNRAPAGLIPKVDKWFTQRVSGKALVLNMLN